eukprot:scaffold16494_cov83-Cyclotella_meneghiniana.AAC.10
MIVNREYTAIITSLPRSGRVGKKYGAFEHGFIIPGVIETTRAKLENHLLDYEDNGSMLDPRTNTTSYHGHLAMHQSFDEGDCNDYSSHEQRLSYCDQGCI